ncbi:MAG: alpha-2-macroglobulin, partial [Roseiflexaceae bacterium]|nr:alpha-2-macroglobulin [Roseiflexaceae bacterium]
RLRLDPSLAAGLRESLGYLEHYEYECAEQTVSRFLPNLLTARALRELGQPNAELEARLPGLVEQGLAKLATIQNGDGGWGWWQGSTSNPHVSAYTVLGLSQAKEQGYTLPDGLLERGQDFLAGTLVATNSANARANMSASDANQQAFVLFALAESGRADATRLGELFEAREKLATDARAFLLMALQRGASADASRIKALLADLNSAAILSATGAHWEEVAPKHSPSTSTEHAQSVANASPRLSMGTNTRTTAIVLEALMRADPANQINSNAVRWLMVARRDGVWATTQESAWALMALTSFMAQSGELDGQYEYGVLLNNAPLASGQVTPADVQTPITLQVPVADLQGQAGNLLTIGRGEGPGRLYYTAHLRTFLPVPELKALERGIGVQRRYVLASCPDGAACPEVREVKLGDVVRVELSMTAPSDLYYLMVEDPLPAGFEAIDPALATSSLLDGRGNGLQEVDAAGQGRLLPPWYSWASRTELRDQKVALFAERLAKGAYVFSYTMRATLPGEYQAIPTTASEMYFPEVYGRADGATLRILK